MIKSILLASISLIFISSVAKAQDGYGDALPIITPKPFTIDKTGKKKPFGSRHYKNHPSYSKWMIPMQDGKDSRNSCCDDKDCDLVNGWRNEKDEWVVEYVSPKTGHVFELVVPYSKILKDQDNLNTFRESSDGNFHACIGETFADDPFVICAVPGDIKS